MNRRCLLSTISWLFVLAQLSFAATFTVTTTSDADYGDFDCSFHAALEAAQGNGEADTINLGEGIFSTGGPHFGITPQKTLA